VATKLLQKERNVSARALIAQIFEPGGVGRTRTRLTLTPGN
jgi:hypothetical protein